MHDSLRTEGDIGDIDIRFTSKPGKGEREWCLLRQNQSPKQENHTHASSSNLHLICKGSSSNRQGGERIARMVFIEAKSVS